MMMMKVIPVERLVQEPLAGILHRDDEEEVTENLVGDIDLVLDLKNGVAFLLDNEIFQIRTHRATTSTITDVVVVELKNRGSSTVGAAINIVDRKALTCRRVMDLAMMSIIHLALAILNLESGTIKGEIVAIAIPVTVTAMNRGTRSVDEK